MRWNGLLAATAATLLIAAAPAAAETYTVTSNVDTTGLCSTTPPNCPSIREAINAAIQNPGPDTVMIPAGTYQLTNFALQIADAQDPITIIGAGARDTTIIGNTDHSARVFEIDDSEVTIRNLAVTGGWAPAVSSPHDFFGGNIWAIHGTVVLDHIRSTGGHASSGGGIGNRNGTMTITNSLIDHNAADNGGADGGGIINFGGNDLGAAHMTIRNSTIAFNTAQSVGGITQYGSDQDSLQLESVTIARNSATNFAGGLNIGQGSSTARGVIFASNQSTTGSQNCGGTAPTSQGANVDDEISCNLSDPTDRSDSSANLDTELRNYGGQTDVLPFIDPSPALNIGGTCPSPDQTDAPRPQDGACDAGAWEFRGPDDGVAPTVTLFGGPQGATTDPSPQFTFASDKPSATFTCSLDGAAPTPCSSPMTYTGLADGEHTFRVVATDAFGNSDGVGVLRTFTVSTAQPAPVPTPAPTVTPTPIPTPTPVANKTVEADKVSGTVLVRVKGSAKFVPLADAVIANGSEIDARKGVVVITTAGGEKAKFYEGLFTISQSGGITTLTLSEKLTGCPKAKRSSASAAAKKPKTRKLWGDGKGKFRTKGSYSAATIRGTKWLVQDTCTTTLTRVAEGVVSVRDDVKKKTITVRKGKSYTARAKK
jgi:hypothetical protein